MLFRFGAFCAQVAALLPIIPLHKAPLRTESNAAVFYFPFMLRSISNMPVCLHRQASQTFVTRARNIFELVITRNWFNYNLAVVKKYDFLKFMVKMACPVVVYYITVILLSFPDLPLLAPNPNILFKL